MPYDKLEVQQILCYITGKYFFKIILRNGSRCPCCKLQVVVKPVEEGSVVKVTQVGQKKEFDQFLIAGFKSRSLEKLQKILKIVCLFLQFMFRFLIVFAV